MSVTIKEAIALIVKEKLPLYTEIIPIEESIGRISAENIKASLSLPRFDNSAMDGYALNTGKKEALKGEEFHIIGEIFAGEDKNFSLQKRQGVKIMTGAMLPPSATLVIPKENTLSIDSQTVRIDKDTKAFANIRRKGEDIDINENIIKSGEKIKSSHIALFASQGITHVKIYKKPKVAVFASGNELKLHFEKLQKKSQIYNSNTPYFLARSKEWGCETIFVGKVKDDLNSIKETIKSSLKSDLILTSGGASVGDADFTKQAFKELGFQTIFSKVQIKPGKPTSFGKIGDTFVLNLPGNPLAGALNFEIFGKLLIEILKGSKNIYHNFIETEIAHDYTKKKGVESVIPGNFDGKGFTVTDKFAPGMVNVLNKCNGFIILSDKVKNIKKGERVKFIPIDWDFQSESFKDFITY